MSMAAVAIVVLLALLEYLFFGLRVGAARAKYGVKAPAITGDPAFERYFRIHQNTLENLVVFIPAIWLFGLYISPLWAAGIGLVFVIARLLYYLGYAAAPEKRAAGFGIGWLACVVLVIGALVGAVLEFS
jgi:glutathione S-transferase